MKVHGFSFEGLEAYKKARLLIKNIYYLQKKFPSEERYALGDQVRRAATSVTANIAEGSGRVSPKEKIHFIEISFGSLMEVFCELQTASDLGYITEEDLDNLRPQFTEIAKLLSGLRNSFQAMLEKSDVRPTINNFKPKDHNP
jgi:four helix bundle protein